ncbi:hypothetical protein C1I98_37980, partial [Spongiactinospora gelatinilytica]
MRGGHGHIVTPALGGRWHGRHPGRTGVPGVAMSGGVVAVRIRSGEAVTGGGMPVRGAGGRFGGGSGERGARRGCLPARFRYCLPYVRPGRGQGAPFGTRPRRPWRPGERPARLDHRVGQA